MNQLPPTRLAEIAWLFLRLGATSFGGPAAHTAMMEDEVVRRRGWLSPEQFLDTVGATQLIPGPNSTELAIHIGRLRGGWPGLLIAGACFILPAALLAGAAAWAYTRFGTIPAAEGLLYGIKSVVIAIVAQALVGLGRSAIKSWMLALVLVAATAAVAAGWNELAVLAGAGACMALARFRDRAVATATLLAAGGVGTSAVAATSTLAATSAVAATPFALGTMFWVFVKVGALLFGSGYVLLAFLRADLVHRLGWLSEQQLLDATAIGQVTPGPLFTTATFIGYLLGGSAGAVLATLGIFLPAFLFVAVSGPLVPRIRRSPLASAALDGVNAASLAMMAVVSWQLARAALVDPLCVLLGLVSCVMLVRFRVHSSWLVLGGAVTGWAARVVWP